jgi:hypothetical protein
MKGLVSRLDRTRTELLANRRRFDREGVSLMTGAREARYALPIESRREIIVRPAIRLSDYRKTPLEDFIEWSFDRVGYVLIPIVVALFSALIVVQTYLHFHRG